jgi:hypothetical protein
MIGHIKASTPKKASLPDFDYNRKLAWDPKDPRALPSQWPCHGQHVAGTMMSNPHAQWQHCKHCNLRLLYVPRIGSPASNMQNHHPDMVTKMLGQLEVLMEGKKPTSAICLAMMEKINAEEKLLAKIGLEVNQPASKSKPKKNVKIPAEEEVIQTAGYSTKSNLSDSWESIKISPRDMLSQEVEEHLTEEERNELMRTIQQRKMQTAANMDSEENLESA